MRSRALPELADEPAGAEVVATELAFRGRVWDIRRDRVAYGGGEFTRDYVAHTGAVGILARDAGGRILLIRQYRHPIRSRDWELPAGLLDVAGEDRLDAAKRELAEEADLSAERWSPLVSYHPSPGGSNEIIHVFLAEGLAPLPPHARSEEEADIEVRWAPLADVVEAVLGGRLHNGTLALAALALHARG